MKTVIFEIHPPIMTLTETNISSILPITSTSVSEHIQISGITHYYNVTRFKCKYDPQSPEVNTYVDQLHAYHFQIVSQPDCVYTIRNCMKFIPIGAKLPKESLVSYSGIIAQVSNSYLQVAPFIPNEPIRYSPVPPEESECLDKLADILFEHSTSLKEGDYLQLMNYLRKKKTYSA